VDWNSAKELMAIVKDVATIVLPLLGVLVGARLAGKSAETNWLRQERLKMYVDLIAKFEAVNSTFSGMVRTARFGDGPISQGTQRQASYKRVVSEFHARVSEVMEVSTNLRILSRHYDEEVHDELSDLWIRMIALADSGNTPEHEWDDCITASGLMVVRLIDESRRELAIPKKGLK
jgi:hypothetical protein